jgi:ABC-type glycerol-3-phosphate transport system permease component
MRKNRAVSPKLAYEAIVQAIFDRVFQPGTRLNIDMLAQQLAMSNTDPGAKGCSLSLYCPFFLLFAAFWLFPVFWSIVLSFQHWTASATSWVGLANYRFVLGLSSVQQAFANLVWYVVVNNVFQLTIALAIAILLDQRFIRRHPGDNVAPGFLHAQHCLRGDDRYPVRDHPRHRRSDGSPPLRREHSYLVVVIAAALVFVIPLWWTIVWGSWHTNEIFSYPPKFLPGPYLLDNLHNLQGNIDILRSFANSLIVTGVSLLGALFFCSLAGFAFAKYRFRLHEPLFYILLATMAIPAQITAIPLFVLIW